jgi:hypothetical protein
MTTTDTSRPAVMSAVPQLTIVPDDTPALLNVTPIVEQHRDGVHHEVQLELTDVQWRQLVGDIAARILTLRGQGRPILSKLMAAGVRPTGIAQQRALDELLELLHGPTHKFSAHHLPPVWDLTPEDAGHLALQLAEASEEPVPCECGDVVQQPTQLTTTCGSCVDRLGGDR